jgi:hypothetical protein
MRKFIQEIVQCQRLELWEIKDLREFKVSQKIFSRFLNFSKFLLNVLQYFFKFLLQVMQPKFFDPLYRLT